VILSAVPGWASTFASVGEPPSDEDAVEELDALVETDTVVEADAVVAPETVLEPEPEPGVEAEVDAAVDPRLDADVVPESRFRVAPESCFPPSAVSGNDDELHPATIDVRSASDRVERPEYIIETSEDGIGWVVIG
jgi:hypothetical protein